MDGYGLMAEILSEERGREERLLAPAKPLFGGGSNLEVLAWVDRSPVDDDISEAMGFKTGAQELVEAVQIDKQPADVLVFPIVFNYRHYVELILKVIVRYASSCGDIESEAKVEPALERHDLARLWNLVSEALGKVDERPGDAELNRAGERIAELHRHDPSSFDYRYTRTKKGEKRKRPGGLALLDLVQFREGMDDLAYTLDGVWDMYARRWDWVCEMRAASGDDYI
jgi:hypothetical protein